MPLENSVGPARHGFGIAKPGGIPRAGLVGLWSLPGVDPRINPGARVEQAARNLFPWSEAFDNAAWYKYFSSATPNAAVAPDGSMTAYKVSASTNTDEHAVRYIGSLLTADYTVSVYAKAAEYHWCFIQFECPIGAWSRVWFNLSTGAIGTETPTGGVLTFSKHISDVGSGWYRVDASFRPANGGAAYIYLAMDVSNGGVIFAGDGTSGIYLWGAQLEVGDHATAYEKTEDRQSFYDFSYHGNHAQRGSTTGSDTNDPGLEPSSRNVMPPEKVNDLTAWITTGTVVDNDTVQLAPGEHIRVWPDAVANTYAVFSADVNIVSGTGTAIAGAWYVEHGTSDSTGSAARLSVNMWGKASIQPPTFSGTGLNDATFNTGTNFTCAADYMPGSDPQVAQYIIEIDSEGTPDTFKWSHDGGSTWEATGVAITGAAQTLDCGVTVTFGATTGHTLGDKWTSQVWWGNCVVSADPSNTSTITVDITNPQVEYCGSSHCAATPFTDPRSESVVQGASFDGVDDYAKTGLTTPSKFTVLVLARADQLAYQQPLSSIYGNGPGVSIKYTVNGDIWYRIGSSTAYTDVHASDAGLGYSVGEWHLVAATYDGGVFKAYLDGGFVNSANVSYDVTGYTFRIGQSPSGTEKFKGQETLVGVYFRPLSTFAVARLSKYIAQRAWDHWGIAVEGYKSTICQKPPMHLGE